MLNVAKNKYHHKRKQSAIYTPLALSVWLYGLLHSHFDKKWVIVDPACGSGRLINPWQANDYHIIGIDIVDQSCMRLMGGGVGGSFHQCDFLNMTRSAPIVQGGKNLILCNPPFNHDGTNEEYNRQLLPELFLRQILKLFGHDAPILLFAPYGLRLNNRASESGIANERYSFLRESCPQIDSIISLPLNIFPGVLFHTEILCFNMPFLKPHYLVPNSSLVSDAYIDEKTLFSEEEMTG